MRSAIMFDPKSRYAKLAPVAVGRCGYGDAVRLDPGGSRTIAFDPGRPGMACPVAALGGDIPDHSLRTRPAGVIGNGDDDGQPRITVVQLVQGLAIVDLPD